MSKENIGIIVEFNPLHNGHKHLIDTIKKENPDCNIVAVMSGNFVQRGELSIYDKWSRAKAGIDYGVDLVIEIPPYFVLNHANIFAKKALEILNEYEVKKIYFGSENLDINEINTIVDKIIDNEDELNSLKNELHSLPKAFSQFIGKDIKPNDILGICYVLEAKKLNLDIIFNRVQRTSGEEFTSASKIRMDLVRSIGNDKSLMNGETLMNTDDYSDIIIGKLITSNIDDNVINYLKDVAINKKPKSFYELIKLSNNSSYTKARLKRDLLKFVLELEGTDERIILSMSEKGKAILKNSEDYKFRHDKQNTDNYRVERFISIKSENTLEIFLSKSTIIK